MSIRPKLLYRWQQAQVVAEVGSMDMARDLEVRFLRAANKQLAQDLSILKTLGHLRLADPVSTCQRIAPRASQAPVLHLCQILWVALSAYFVWH